MPVGTQGTVKGVTIDQVAATGADMILGNTYHLALRPGHETVRRLGGLHGMTGWEGPILTDSGGFQVFSLDAFNQVDEQAATFRSHLDGSVIRLTPEHSIEIQESLGSDVAMVLDHVVALPADHDVVQDAMERSIRWAKRCLGSATRDDQAKFAIVQGGLDIELRTQCARELAAMDFDGFAVGGLSVGEPPSEMYRITAATTPELPEHKPRYLMGVGRPIDLIESVARGIDLFDCVMPTRNGRNGLAFTDSGSIKLRNRGPPRRHSPASGGLSLHRLPPITRLPAASLSCQRNARSDFAFDSQPDLLSADHARIARRHREGSFC